MKKASIIPMKPITILAVILFSVIYSYGQQMTVQELATPEAAMGAKIDTAIATLHLDTLHGKIPVLYSKNYKVRAETIQFMVEKCVAFYKPEFPEVKFSLKVLVLDRKAWHHIHLNEYEIPYGMPNAWSSINKLFIAADKEAVDKLFGVNENSPDHVLSKFDCVALHELGHVFLKRYNHTFTKKKWSDEFLASYFAICFFQQHKNYAGLPQVDESDFKPHYRTLADFERLYSKVGAPNYAWYQGKFQEFGKRLYPKFKTKLLRIFIDNYATDGKKLPPLTLLKQIAPEITEQWVKEME